jgi:hypothetical protein
MLCAKRVSRTGASTLALTALCTQGQSLSTASFNAAVQTVGKREPNPGLFPGLSAFHFSAVQFSKTWTVFIHAIRLVSGPLSTFPVQTVTTTKYDELIIEFFP